MAKRTIEGLHLLDSPSDEMLVQTTTEIDSNSNLVSARSRNLSSNVPDRRSSRNRTKLQQTKPFENNARITVSFHENGKKVSNVVWNCDSEEHHDDTKSTGKSITVEYSPRKAAPEQDVHTLSSLESSTPPKGRILPAQHKHQDESEIDSDRKQGFREKNKYNETDSSSIVNNCAFITSFDTDRKLPAESQFIPVDHKTQKLTARDKTLSKVLDPCDVPNHNNDSTVVETRESKIGKSRVEHFSPKSNLEETNTIQANDEAAKNTRGTRKSTGFLVASNGTPSETEGTEHISTSVEWKAITDDVSNNHDGVDKEKVSINERADISINSSVAITSKATAPVNTDEDVRLLSSPTIPPRPGSKSTSPTMTVTTTTTSLTFPGRVFRPRAAKAIPHPIDYDACDDDLIKMSVGSRGRSMSSSSGSDDVTLIDVIGLSRLDTGEYGLCLEADSMRIHNEFLFALAFPWYDPRLELDVTSPFDIEDLPAILHADDNIFGYYASKNTSISRYQPEKRVWECYQPHPEVSSSVSSATSTTTAAGTTTTASITVSVPLLFDAMRPQTPFGSLPSFGRFETGRIRRVRHEGPGKVSYEANPNVAGGMVVCQTRRGTDPGVIELLTHLVNNDSNTKEGSEEGRSEQEESAANEHHEENFRLKRAKTYETISALPWVHDSDLPDPTAKVERYLKPLRQYFDCEDAAESLIEALRARRCLRKINLSVKVGGVSSRKCLFPDCDQIDNYSEAIKKRKLMVASFPASIQTGTAASCPSKVQEADMEWGIYNACWNGINPSFQAELQQPVANVKQSGKDKAVYVGRCRLIWSEFNTARGTGVGQRTLPVKSQQQQQVSNSMYRSTLSGQALEGRFTQGFKRPREATVGVRVDGHLMSETDCNTPGQIENFETSNSSIQCLELLHGHCNLLDSLLRKQALLLSLERSGGGVEDGKISYRSPNTQISERYKGFNFKRPEFKRVPCSKGFFHLFCHRPGDLAVGTNIDDLFVSPFLANGAYKAKSCSVCQQSEQELQPLKRKNFMENDTDLAVEECIECGLLVHRGCCQDSGAYVAGVTPPFIPINNKTNFWMCTICWDSKPKDLIEPPLKRSRRKSKFPSKYEDARLPSYLQKRSGQDKETESSDKNSGHLSQDNSIDAVDRRERKKCIRPSPSCVFCPHSGGAMSKVEERSDQTNIDNTQSKEARWTHEICRIWCNSPFQRRAEEEAVCAFCGDYAQGCCLVKCAAKTCHVVFHPMCAFIMSKLPECKGEDSPCRPSFHFLDIFLKDEEDTKPAKDEFETKAQKENIRIIPAILCGWHSKNEHCVTHKFMPPCPLQKPLQKLLSPNVSECCKVYFHGVDVNMGGNAPAGLAL